MAFHKNAAPENPQEKAPSQREQASETTNATPLQRETILALRERYKSKLRDFDDLSKGLKEKDNLEVAERKRKNLERTLLLLEELEKTTLAS